MFPSLFFLQCWTSNLRSWTCRAHAHPLAYIVSPRSFISRACLVSAQQGGHESGLEEDISRSLFSSQKHVPGCRCQAGYISGEEGPYLLLSLTLHLLGCSAPSDYGNGYIKKGNFQLSSQSSVTYCNMGCYRDCPPWPFKNFFQQRVKVEGRKMEGSGRAAQFVKPLLSTNCLWVPQHKPGMVGHPCNHGTQEIEAGGAGSGLRLSSAVKLQLSSAL